VSITVNKRGKGPIGGNAALNICDHVRPYTGRGIPRTRYTTRYTRGRTLSGHGEFQDGTAGDEKNVVSPGT